MGRDHLRVSRVTGSARVSIHPPRVGRDRVQLPSTPRCGSFNPPSPCGEGRCVGICLHPVPGVSIHPPRVGRDKSSPLLLLKAPGFNPPSPCGEGLDDFDKLFEDRSVSIHPPRVGRDGRKGFLHLWNKGFQSTLPVWGGTHWLGCPRQHHQGFNPPSPCGEGQQKLTKILCKLLR